MARFNRNLGFFVLIGTALVGSVYGEIRFMYPFGARACFLPCLNSALQQYAQDHGGTFPDGATPHLALQKLFPQYMPNAEGLAGVSGDREATARALKTGGILTSNHTSWVYIPGQTRSHPDTILVYERRSGLGGNGLRRSGRRAVGYADGSAHLLPEEVFQTTLKEQERRRTVSNE